MFSSNILFRLFLAAGAAVLFAVPARPVAATCGLHVCPIPVAVSKDSAAGAALFPSQIWVETRYAAFDIAGRGSYFQSSLTGVYEHRLFRVGGVLPLIYLNGPQGNTAGLGNATVFGEFYVLNSGGTRLSVGSQIETPTGNHDKGLGASHFMAVPYVNLWQTWDAWRLALQVGYQQTLGSHSHGANAAVLYVNPHSDSEMLSRVMVSYTWFGAYSAELNSSFRQVTAHDAVGDKSFLDLGGAFRMTLGNSLALRVGVDIPVTSVQRYLYQAYAGLFYYF